MSDPRETIKTLAELNREFQSEITKLQQQKSDLSDAVHGVEKIVEDHLACAKNFYSKKDWVSAFAEWERACAFLEEGDEFRKKVIALKESHENLIKVNRELAEIKQILNQRSAPSPADRKFVQGAHEEVSGQVKNVYSYLGQQLRAERTPKTLNFWWPVILSLVLLGAGSSGLWTYHVKARAELQRQTQKGGEAARLQITLLQSQRDEAVKKSTALKEEYDAKIEELKSQNAGWRNAGREKIEELEVKLKDSEQRNEEQALKIEKLLEDSLKAIAP